MKAYQERVFSERESLLQRRQSLVQFIGAPTFKTLPEDEQDRLIRQSKIMQDYINILTERITDFEA